jgi:hypothetical protein
MNFSALFSIWLAVGGILTTLILLVGHWFPWRDWLGRELTRIEAYVYGTLAITLGFAVWRISIGDWITPAGLLLIDVASGAGVTASYLADRMGLDRAKARRASKLIDPDTADGPR